MAQAAGMLRSGIAGAVLAAGLAIVGWPGAAQDVGGPVPGSVPECAEDVAAGEVPTISSRFDLKEPGEGGTSFDQARTRALNFCTRQACTMNGNSVMRTASVYAVGLMRRRFIAGFVCRPEARPGDAGTSANDVAYTIGEPSEIDAALAKANQYCAGAHRKAELSDLRKQDGAIVATFACAM
jgi:hypothetical protein